MGLSIKNIKFGYSKDQLVLDDISFDVNAGETLCILGASGSGKSTLLRVVAGLLPNNKDQKYEGTVQFNGESIDNLKSKGRLSYMFQEASLLPYLTVKGNVELPTKIIKNSSYNSVEETIRIVGLSSAINKYPKDLSGGMKTRTALARSFVTKPTLLLLDEPFSSLDYARRNSLYFELKTLQERDNTAIVMVTHSIEEATELAERIIIIGHNGRLLQRYELDPITLDNVSILADGSKSITASRWMDASNIIIDAKFKMQLDYNSFTKAK